MNQITQEELETIAANYNGRTFFEQALGTKYTLNLFTSYTSFNSVFA